LEILVEPFASFENGIERAKYLCRLHDVLFNTAKRRATSSWLKKAKLLLGWRNADHVIRLKSSTAYILIRDNDREWNRGYFESDYLSELPRAALVLGVSAMDRFFHDLIGSHMIRLLTGNDADRPKHLAQYSIPLLLVEKCITRALESRKGEEIQTRPRVVLQKEFRQHLNGSTFQGSGQIDQAFKLLGLKAMWKDIADVMGDSAKNTQDILNQIVKRRNQIVHEGDQALTARPRHPQLNEISNKDSLVDLEWLDNFVTSTDMAFSTRSS
jgi:hypothetical protein